MAAVSLKLPHTVISYCENLRRNGSSLSKAWLLQLRDCTGLKIAFVGGNRLLLWLKATNCPTCFWVLAPFEAPPPQASSERVLNMTPLMDRLSLSLLINPCSMACSSLVTITPCACCHLAVLCLQSYSVHLSDTIYGKQFVVYHGSCSFLRTFFSFFLYFLHICYSWWISSQVWNLRISRFDNVVLCPDKLKHYKRPVFSPIFKSTVAKLAKLFS